MLSSGALEQNEHYTHVPYNIFGKKNDIGFCLVGDTIRDVLIESEFQSRQLHFKKTRVVSSDPVAVRKCAFKDTIFCAAQEWSGSRSWYSSKD